MDRVTLSAVVLNVDRVNLPITVETAVLTGSPCQLPSFNHKIKQLKIERMVGKLMLLFTGSHSIQTKYKVINHVMVKKANRNMYVTHLHKISHIANFSENGIMQ